MMGTEKIIKLHLCEKLQLKNKFLKIIVKAMCISGNWKIHCFNVFSLSVNISLNLVFIFLQAYDIIKIVL